MSDKNPLPDSAPNLKAVAVARNATMAFTIGETGNDTDLISPTRLRAAAKAGVALSVAERVALMQKLGTRFGIPPNGWPGQSRIYVDGDIRLVWLLRRLTRFKVCEAVSANLQRAYTLVAVDPILVLTTSAREYDQSIDARSSTRFLDTWHYGGLDFLWKNRDRLGLPNDVIKHWQEGRSFPSPETNEVVYPGLIPERDQVPAYAAQINLSYSDFKKHVVAKLGLTESVAALSSMSEDAESIWKAFAFLAPGGRRFESKKGLIHGQTMGAQTALGYLLHTTPGGTSVDLNRIIDLGSHLDHTEYLRIAKARAVEAAFIRHLLAGSQVHP